jgi:methylated-DNA-[protein]-cysteine S-methyltransferase
VSRGQHARPTGSIRPRLVEYEAQGWGRGELWLDGSTLVWHVGPEGGARRSRAGHPLAARLLAYYAGEAVDFDDVAVLLDDLPAFQQALAAELRRVPRGEVVTYGELAERAGRPRAARAAGTFCAHNRAAVIIPCHRVISAGGIGGYGSLGVEYKRRLLALEGNPLGRGAN